MTLRLAKWKSTLLNAFWSPQKSVLIHMGPPHVATYRELIAPTSSADHVADLCGAPWGDEQTARRALGPQLDALVARTDLSLASFLDGLGSSDPAARARLVRSHRLSRARGAVMRGWSRRLLVSSRPHGG